MAPVEFGPQRLEDVVAERAGLGPGAVDVGQGDAVGVQFVEGMGQFLEGGVDVGGGGEVREEAEPAGVVVDRLAGDGVEPAGECPTLPRGQATSGVQLAAPAGKGQPLSAASEPRTDSASSPVGKR
jgi:hypothetical protein